MIDPVADLEVFLARLDAERARVLAETAKAANPHLNNQLPSVLEQFDRMKEKLESARPQLEEMRKSLLAQEASRCAPRTPRAPAPANDKQPRVPEGWPLSEVRIAAIGAALAQRARAAAPPEAAPAHPAGRPIGDVKDMDSSQWRERTSSGDLSQIAPAPPEKKEPPRTPNPDEVRDIPSDVWGSEDKF